MYYFELLLNNVYILIFNRKLDCSDTPDWTDVDGDDCNMFRHFCFDGEPEPDVLEHLFNEYYGWPQQNCCGCGK